MRIKLSPTTQFHQIVPQEEGDRPYARLWQGYTQNGEKVQALIFGVAFEEEQSADAALLLDDARKLDTNRREMFPPCVLAPRFKGLATKPKEIN